VCDKFCLSKITNNLVSTTNHAIQSNINKTGYGSYYLTTYLSLIEREGEFDGGEKRGPALSILTASLFVFRASPEDPDISKSSVRPVLFVTQKLVTELFSSSPICSGTRIF
jgi:hypothetical protein